jgi:hypothetical protein
VAGVSKLTVLGLIFLFAGLLLLGYQGGAALMGTDRMAGDFIWVNLRPADFLCQATLDWIGSISFQKLQALSLLLVKIPLFLWFFGLACLCFLFAAFQRR